MTMKKKNCKYKVHEWVMFRVDEDTPIEAMHGCGRSIDLSKIIEDSGAEFLGFIVDKTEEGAVATMEQVLTKR